MQIEGSTKLEIDVSRNMSMQKTIRKKRIDPECFATEREIKLLDQSIIDEKEGKLATLEDIYNARRKIR